jgi:hypothetical protein
MKRNLNICRLFLVATIAVVSFISCDTDNITNDRLAVPTHKEARIINIDGNTEKLTWEPEGTLAWEAPIGDRVLFGFPLPAGERFENYDLGKFDLKIEGGPVDVMIFVERPGEKRRLYRPIDIFEPPEGWQTIHLDLSQPEIIRESHYETTEPRITFNLWSVKTGYPDEDPSRRISIRNVRLTKRHMDVRWNGVDYTIVPEQSGDLVYEYPVIVGNLDGKKRHVTARMDRVAGRIGSASITPTGTVIDAGDSAAFKATLRIPAERLNELPVLYCEWFLPVFSIDDVPDSDEGILRSSDRIALPILKMPEKLGNPIVLFDRDGLRQFRERYRTTEWGRKEGDSIIRQAENILKNEIAVPDEAGWTSAYYYCHEHRCGLQYKGPDKHYCPVGGEYRDVDFMGVDLDRDRRTFDNYNYTRWSKTLALAYALTDDKRFSRTALEILNQYKEKYFNYEWMDLDGSTETIDKGRMIFSKYMESYNCFIHLVTALDILKGTGGVSKEAADDIERRLILPGLVEITDYRMGVLCRQTSITATALAVGLSCKHAPLIAFATASPFGYYSLRRVSATADGIGHGHGYAQLFCSKFFDMAEQLYRVGLNTFDHELKRYIDGSYWWNVPMSPGRLNSIFPIAAKHYPDPLYRVETKPSLIHGEPPPFKGKPADISNLHSVNFPNSGVTILRRPWKEDTIAAEFKWSMPDNRGEFSVLSLGLYFNGYTCQSYPGHFHWGSTDLHHDWQIQSASHSTIVVDRRNQSGMKDYIKDHYMPHPSEQIFYEDGKNAAVTVAYNDRIYPGVKIWRAVSILDGAYLVIEILRSNKEHVYDRWFHGVPDQSNGLEGIPLDMKLRNDPLGSEGGYQTLTNLSSAVTGKNLNCDWIVPVSGKRKQFMLSMSVLNNTPLEVIHGFEWSHQFRTREKEFLLLSRKAKNADFIVLYEPHSGTSRLTKSERFTVTNEKGSTMDAAVGVNITLGKTSYEIILNPTGETVQAAGGLTNKVFSIVKK